jgi:tetratricopeptide (TPR) repeat protein
MMKNESERIHVTLESVKTFADSLTVYDTGSTDNSIDIVSEFARENNIKLNLLVGEFKNFAESRNELLDFADTFQEIDYYLLLDSNDELQKSDLFKEYVIQNNDNFKALLVCQSMSVDDDTIFFNTKLVKARTDFRFVGVVHEYLCTNEYKNDVKVPREKCVIYQDRSMDIAKSEKRFVRDREMLIHEFEKDSTNCRTVFYLAQTCLWLGRHEEALKYYLVRIEMGGFYEEKFESLIKIGDCMRKLDRKCEECMVYYIQAFNFLERAEPLVIIGEYYYKAEKWKMAYTFLSLACSLDYPTNCHLFINKYWYDYYRWYLMGIVAYYTENLDEGINACIKAIASKDREIDKRNLKCYIEKKYKIKT